MEISSIGEIISYLTDNKKFFYEKFGVNRIGIFGSFVKGRQMISSDIDMVVEFEKSRKNIQVICQQKPRSSKSSSKQITFTSKYQYISS